MRDESEGEKKSQREARAGDRRKGLGTTYGVVAGEALFAVLATEDQARLLGRNRRRVRERALGLSARHVVLADLLVLGLGRQRCRRGGRLGSMGLAGSSVAEPATMVGPVGSLEPAPSSCAAVEPAPSGPAEALRPTLGSVEAEAGLLGRAAPRVLHSDHGLGLGHRGRLGLLHHLGRQAGRVRVRRECGERDLRERHRWRRARDDGCDRLGNLGNRACGSIVSESLTSAPPNKPIMRH